MNREIERFIERMGLLWSDEGFPRIAGRIYAFLLLSPEASSLNDIAGALKVSKPSVSNDARMLHQLGLIERVGLPGDRKDYYQITRDSIERSIETRIARVETFHQVMVSAASLPVKSDDVQHRIEAYLIANRTVIDALRKVIKTLRTSRPPALSSTRSKRK